MAIDGYVLHLDLPESWEMVSRLRRCSNNLNQVAKRVNETGRIYTEDLEDLTKTLQTLGISQPNCDGTGKGQLRYKSFVRLKCRIRFCIIIYEVHLRIKKEQAKR